MPVDLRCESGASARHAPIAADARRLLRLSGMSKCELSVMLVNDRAIRRLNRQFRSHDQATDVLSFPQLDDVPPNGRPGSAFSRTRPPTILGDIVISIDTARRQAARLKQPLRARIQSLLIHGFLHLLGYDHERSAAEARRMLARELELASALTKPRRSASTSKRR